MVVHQRQIFAHAVLRALFRIGIVAGCNRLHHRMDDAAAARGIAGRNRRQNQLGKRQAVADAQRALAEQGNEVIADTRAQPRFQQAARNHNRHPDQPDQRVGQRGERVFHRSGGDFVGRGEFRVGQIDGNAGNRHQHDGDNGERADRHRLADNRRNDADEHRQELPRLRFDARRRGNQQDDHRNRHRHGGGDGFETELGGRFRIGFWIGLAHDVSFLCAAAFRLPEKTWQDLCGWYCSPASGRGQRQPENAGMPKSSLKTGLGGLSGYLRSLVNPEKQAAFAL